MNVNPRISFPPEVDFVLISSFIREACRIAFAMQTLDPPLDLAFSSDGELYSDVKWVELINLTHSHIHSNMSQGSWDASLKVELTVSEKCSAHFLRCILHFYQCFMRRKQNILRNTHVNQWLTRHTFSQVQAQFWLRVHRSTGGVSRVACTVGGRHCHTEGRGGH